MRHVSKKSSLKTVLQVLVVLLVGGLFIAACGSDDPANLFFDICGTDLYCPTSTYCCPAGYPYYCAVKTDGTGDGCFTAHPGGACSSSVEVCS